MIEIMIERWAGADDTVEFVWSVWRNGHRMQLGGPQPSADAAEREATSFCRTALGTAPDSVTRL